MATWILTQYKVIFISDLYFAEIHSFSASIAKNRSYPRYSVLRLVCFYSERPQLSKNIFFYLWSMFIAEDRWLAEECSPRLCGGISLISWQFYSSPLIRTQYYGLTKESPWLHVAYFESNMKFYEWSTILFKLYHF